MIQKLITLPRQGKQLLQIGLDFAFLCFALWFAFFIRLESVWPTELQDAWPWILIGPWSALPVFVYLGLYQAVVRYIVPRFVVTILKAVFSATCLLMVTVALCHMPGFPRSVYFLYLLLAAVLIGGSRLAAREWLGLRLVGESGKKLVAIYGAGSAGTQICKALQASQDYWPLAFLDDNPELQGMEILGCRVYPPAQLDELIQRYRLEEVILAIPSQPSWRRRELVQLLEAHAVVVKVLPGLTELITRSPRLGDLRQLEIEELLGRDPVEPLPHLLRACIAGKSVLVTGAGGSIGAELCRQIAEQGPAKLVLYELSEAALYRISLELEECFPELRHEAVLGSTLDRERLEAVLAAHEVATIYHAAAYKHVPLVELNLIEGVRNNVMGALATVEAACHRQVETLILISSDKAVRPANIMGATKRLSEMIVQTHADQAGPTRLKIVRFGNVLGSSGSVLPRFRDQIRRGGPVTVTDRRMTRFFMTPREAAQLTLQAGAMGTGGDVFVLDMGEPVRILDLARKMIHLSGLTIKEAGQGQIEIAFVGLRPGEKLYEELVIGGSTSPTEHPRILRAVEPCPRAAEVEALLARLQAALAESDAEAIRAILRKPEIGYVPAETSPGSALN